MCLKYDRKANYLIEIRAGVPIGPRKKTTGGEKPEYSFKLETQISIYFGRGILKNKYF